MFISWLPFAKTFTHRAQAQANDISKQLELLKNKNFSDFIKDENLQKKKLLHLLLQGKRNYLHSTNRICIYDLNVLRTIQNISINLKLVRKNRRSIIYSFLVYKI